MERISVLKEESLDELERHYATVVTTKQLEVATIAAITAAAGTTAMATTTNFISACFIIDYRLLM